MKTEYTKTNLKDNIASAAVLAATAVAILGAIAGSTDARANRVAMQQMETIVVTARRVEAPRLEVTRMDTIVVTAPREANVLVASN